MDGRWRPKADNIDGDGCLLMVMIYVCLLMGDRDCVWGISALIGYWLVIVVAMMGVWCLWWGDGYGLGVVGYVEGYP